MEGAHHWPSLGRLDPHLSGPERLESPAQARFLPRTELETGHPTTASFQPRGGEKGMRLGSIHFGLPSHPTASRPTRHRKATARYRDAERGAQAQPGVRYRRCGRPRSPPSASTGAGMREGSPRDAGSAGGGCPGGVRPSAPPGGSGDAEEAAAKKRFGSLGFQDAAQPAATTCTGKDPPGPAVSPADGCGAKCAVLLPRSASVRRRRARSGAGGGRADGRQPGAWRPLAPRRGLARVSCSNKQ